MEEADLDSMLEAMKKELTQIAAEPAYYEFGYLTQGDISQLSSNVTDSQILLNGLETPIIAIKAPSGSTVSVGARDE
jgi:cob(I)alamin adenosyltransferase